MKKPPPDGGEVTGQDGKGSLEEGGVQPHVGSSAWSTSARKRSSQGMSVQTSGIASKRDTALKGPVQRRTHSTLWHRGSRSKSTRNKVGGTQLTGSRGRGKRGRGRGGAALSETEVLADVIVPLLSSPPSQPAWHQIQALH